MTDYLRRLAERQIEPTRALQPRPIALFEPVVGGTGAAWWPVELVAEPREARDAPDLEQPSPHAPRLAPTLSSPNHPLSRSTGLGDEQTAPKPPPRLPALPERTAPSLAAAVAEAPKASAPAFRAIVPAPPDRPAPIVARTTLAVPPEAAQVAERRAVPTAAPTSIHVTIGRIEVRAVMPPPAPPPPRTTPRAPRRSLEDYLKQQHGGRR